LQSFRTALFVAVESAGRACGNGAPIQGVFGSERLLEEVSRGLPDARKFLYPI